MSEYNRFSEHYRIDQYLKKKSSFGIKTISIKRNDNVLSNFPIGLIIISKEELKYEDKLDFINQYACKLFRIKDNTNIKELKEKFGEFVKLTKNQKKSGQTLREIIFNYSSFNVELDNFIPFECTYSKNIILYIKINEIGDEKYIVIDKYDKYIEESKYIELSLIKTINYQYLHTLYHELNNPLNALLSLSGDKNQFNSSDISNSRIENKPSIVPKKTLRQKRGSNYGNSKKDKTGLVSLSSQKLTNQDSIDCKIKKKFEFENSHLSDKITLLVNIIKIFIKNFILYLKTRADNLLMIKNEFNNQSETSDIMNAVEVSDYEKELTKHKCIKINLEYIFNLYLEKFLCLFKYKEIEVETNFEKLKNLYVITDEFNFIYYIRQIYTYLYYIVPKKEGFAFDYQEEKNTIKIIIKKSNDSQSKGVTEFHSNISKGNIDDMHQIIQTKEMTKEVLYSMSKRLDFLLEINDKENSDNNNVYLTITMPIHQKDKSEEDDEFKDEEISEMVQKNAFLLEDKLKRPFQNFGTNDTSTNHIIDLDKSGDDKKDSDSFISFPKRETNLKNYYSNNHLRNLNKASAKNLSAINENNKKTVLSSKQNDNNFLNKCLKISDIKNTEKDKDIKDKGKNKNQNLLKLYDVKPSVNHRSDKNVLYTNLSKSSANESKSQMLSGVFTKINNFGCSEVLDCNDISISNNTENNQSNHQEITTKNNNQNILLNGNKINLDSTTQNSTYLKSNIQGIKNSKIQNNSYVISDIVSPQNKGKNINININNNNIINIINNDHNINQFNLSDLKKQDLVSLMNKKDEEKEERNNKGGGDENKRIRSKSNNKINILPELDNLKQKRFSHNVSPQFNHINPKDCMTFFSNEKKDSISKEKKTIYNDNIKENDFLFEEAKKERKLCLKKNMKNNFASSSDVPINSQFEEEELEEGEEDEELEDLNKLEEEEEEQEECNCSDILIVDDEKFNVMASQRMIKNIGYQTDAAYNGEECINLIKEKQKLNCKCNKNHYKLILLDIVMPVLDGISTAKKVQEMITNKEIDDNITIVFVSGNIDGEELKNSLLQIGCVKECLQKPVGIDKYRKILEKYYK